MSPRQVVAEAAKWGKAFWADWAERVASSLIYAVITLITSSVALDDVRPEVLWTVVGLPVVLTALKGLVANMKDATSGASLLNSPPGPVLDDAGPPGGPPGGRGQVGAFTLAGLGGVGVVLVLVGLVLLLATHLTTLGWIVIVVGAVFLVAQLTSTGAS